VSLVTMRSVLLHSLLQIPSFLAKLWILSMSERTFSSQIPGVSMKTMKQAFFLVFLDLSSILAWNISGRGGAGRANYQTDWEVVGRRLRCGLLDTPLGKMMLLVAF